MLAILFFLFLVFCTLAFRTLAFDRISALDLLAMFLLLVVTLALGTLMLLIAAQWRVAFLWTIGAPVSLFAIFLVFYVVELLSPTSIERKALTIPFLVAAFDSLGLFAIYIVLRQSTDYVPARSHTLTPDP